MKIPILITIILTSFFAPSAKIFAKGLLLPSTFAGHVVVNQDLPIPVRTSDNLAGVTISFHTNGLGVTFTPLECTTNSAGNCTVNFRSINTGTYDVGISAPGYDTNAAPIQVIAQTGIAPTNTDTTYTPLAPLPGIGDKNCLVTVTTTDANGVTSTTTTMGTNNCIDTSNKNSACPFGKYLNAMIKLIIGLIAVFAVVMIVLGGMEYITSELISSKEHGKERILNAVLGLIIALGAYLLLNTINPQLLNICLDQLPEAKITIGGESSLPFQPISNQTLQAHGINCSPSAGVVGNLSAIAQNFMNKTTYDMARRNTADATTVYVDCSSFVDQVYYCAGVPKPGDNTTAIFGSGGITITSFNGIKVNNVDLAVGDLLGWKPGESAKFAPYGHVVMYVGSGNVVEAHGGSSVNQGIRVVPLSFYQSEFKYIRRF